LIEKLQKYLPQASSGKQTGNVLDIISMLASTGAAHVLHSGMDVAGFDASVQLVSQLQFLSMIREVMQDIECLAYLCYRSMKVNQGPGQAPLIISALSVLISDMMTRLQPQSTKVKGRVIPFVETADPTFPSGLGYTSVHHTIRLISAVYGDLWADLFLGIVSTLQEMRALGDDIRLTFYGPITKCERDLLRAQASVNAVGFKTETESSVSTVEFLEQRAVLGAPVLYPDRVSLLTAEKPRESKGPGEKMSELLALAYDLGNRVPNPHFLIHVLYSLYLFGAAKITLRVSNAVAGKVFQKSEFKEKVHCQGTFGDLSPTSSHDTFFMSFMCPLSYAWVSDGPGLPPPSMPRADGTYTPVPNFYSLRGVFSKVIPCHSF